MRLSALEERLANLEGIQEDLNKREIAYSELTDYIKDLRSDLRDVRRARTIYGAAALFIVGFLLFLLVGLAFDPRSPISKLPQYPAAALLIGVLTGAIVILLTLAKSAHRLPTERQAEETNLPQVELITQFLKAFKS
jgi:hypothetical protein